MMTPTEITEAPSKTKLRDLLWQAILNGTKSGSEERMRLLSALGAAGPGEEKILLNEGTRPHVTEIGNLHTEGRRHTDGIMYKPNEPPVAGAREKKEDLLKPLTNAMHDLERALYKLITSLP